MNIQSTQNYSTQFKSAYPVVHWIRETNGSYAPAVSKTLNKKLQGTVIRLLNSQDKKVLPEKANFINYIRGVISSCDNDFAVNMFARSFYNNKGGWINGQFEPFGYILTAQNAKFISEKYGKAIGTAKSEAPKGFVSAEIGIALTDYFQRGLVYVKNLASRFKDKDNIHYALHTKFEILRSKSGKIKEYRLEDVRFCPQEGPDNPFVRTGYIKK